MRDLASVLPLSVEGLTFRAGAALLLDRVAFAVPRHGITAIIGPNGAGKSLLLRLCHGLLTPSAGTVRWAQGDGVVAGLKRHAMVFQRPVMLRRSAAENIAHALSAAGLPRALRPSRLAEAIGRFGLGDLSDRPARLLSGGEQQRLAIARAWALGPELMFLDEPTSQLDPGATRQIEAMLSSLRQDGMTLLLTTHDLGQARRLADRVLILNRGRLHDDGATQRVFAEPKTPEARAFLAGDLPW